MLGDCFKSAGRALMEAWLGGRAEGLTLVHGRPTLTVEPFSEYGHAWIEFFTDLDQMSKFTGKHVQLPMVLDTETGDTYPRDIYYAVGRIDTTKCLRYTADEMRIFVLDTGHWGPWEGPGGVGPLPGHKGN